jgi:protein SCO1/2
MLHKSNRIQITVVGLMAIIALVLGIFVSQFVTQPSHTDKSRFHGTWLDKPRAVSAFNLFGMDHVPFSNASLQHHWTLLFFGFTHCPSMCPTTMAELAKFYQLLESKGIKPLPQVVFISLDPDRDDLDRLTRYVTAFDPRFYGVRGDLDAVKSMAKEMGVAYAKVALSAEQQDSYTIEHTGTLMLLNPEGQLTAFFTMPHNAELLAEDYQLALG